MRSGHGTVNQAVIRQPVLVLCQGLLSHVSEGAAAIGRPRAHRSSRALPQGSPVRRPRYPRKRNLPNQESGQPMAHDHRTFAHTTTPLRCLTVPERTCYNPGLWGRAAAWPRNWPGMPATGRVWGVFLMLNRPPGEAIRPCRDQDGHPR